LIFLLGVIDNIYAIFAFINFEYQIKTEKSFAGEQLIRDHLDGIQKYCHQ